MSVATKQDSAFSRFFRAKRGDSPFKRLLIHLTLIFCSIIAVYPVLRVVSVSLRPGDRLLLTKPLGTGVLLAADMQGRARGPWVDAALERPETQAPQLLAVDPVVGDEQHEVVEERKARVRPGARRRARRDVLQL